MKIRKVFACAGTGIMFVGFACSVFFSGMLWMPATGLVILVLSSLEGD